MKNEELLKELESSIGEQKVSEWLEGLVKISRNKIISKAFYITLIAFLEEV